MFASKTKFIRLIAGIRESRDEGKNFCHAKIQSGRGWIHNGACPSIRKGSMAKGSDNKRCGPNLDSDGRVAQKFAYRLGREGSPNGSGSENESEVEEGAMGRGSNPRNIKPKNHQLKKKDPTRRRESSIHKVQAKGRLGPQDASKKWIGGGAQSSTRGRVNLSVCVGGGAKF